MKIGKIIFIGILGIFFSAVIGLLSFLFLRIESIGGHFLWHTLPEHFPSAKIFIAGIICLLASFLFGFLKTKWGDFPKAGHDVIHELKETGRVCYFPLWKQISLALLVLVAGAGVGPEATLITIIIMASIWQADKLRFLYFSFDEVQKVNFLGKIKMIFSPTKYLQQFDKNAENPTKNQKFFKKGMLGLFIVNGILVFFTLNEVTGQSPFITKFSDIVYFYKDLWLVIPIFVYSLFVACAYLWLDKKSENFLKQKNFSPKILAYIGGFAIFLIGIFAPILLFSGQHSVHTLTETALQYSPLLLIGLAILKLLFANICLRTGWVGGDIFPIAFAGMLQGFAFVSLFPGVNTSFIVMISLLCLTLLITHQEMVMLIFVLLFFPAEMWIVMIPIGILLIFLKKKFFGKILQKLAK